MKDKLTLQGIDLKWWMLIPVLVSVVILNIYFIIVIHRFFVISLLLPIYGTIKFYYSPKCIITKKTAVIRCGNRTVRQLEKITAAGVLFVPKENKYIFLCGEEIQKIKKYELSENMPKKACMKDDNAQGKWESMLLFFLLRRAKKSERIILIPYSPRRLQKLTSYFDVEIAEGNLEASHTNQKVHGMVVDILNVRMADL